MDAQEIKALCSTHIEAFCRDHLSAGRREGSAWRVGSVHNTSGSSMVVHLSGGRQGQFFENNPAEATGAKSLIDVFMHRYGCDFKQACHGLEGWLRSVGCVPRAGTVTGGLRGPHAVRPPGSGAGERGASPPPRLEGKPVEEGTPGWLYLTEKRGIAPEAIRASRVREGDYWFPQLRAKVPGLQFPVFDASGEQLLMCKFIALHRYFLKGPLQGRPEYAEAEAPSGGEVAEKLVCANKGAEYHLMGLWTVPADKPEVPVVIAEGEMDWLSWLSEGVAAVCVPFGAKADTVDPHTGELRTNAGNAWIDHDWDWLQGREELVIAMDEDDTGRAARETLLRRLGQERCRVVVWPNEGDDANEVHQRDPAELMLALDNAASVDPEELRSARDYEGEIWNAFFPEDGQEAGLPPPWNMPFRFRPGETTVWTGYNKHGKTICQTFTMVWLASKGQRCCIASLEIAAARTLQNVARMAMGRSKPVRMEGNSQVPDAELFERAMAWMEGRFWIYDKVGEVHIADVLEVFAYAARRYGVTQFVLDSLMKLSVNEEDAEQIKDLMNQVTAFARKYQAHVHFVAHSKKSTEKRPEEKYPPRKHDVKGSVAITNIPDNVIVIWRNKMKERTFEELKVQWEICDERGEIEKRDALGTKIEAVQKQADALWTVEAQRYGSGAEPLKYLWFDVHGSWQYFESAEAMDKGARVYID